MRITYYDRVACVITEDREETTFKQPTQNFEINNLYHTKCYIKRPVYTDITRGVR